MVDTDIEDIIRHSIERSSKMIKLWQRYKPFINAGVQELITYPSQFYSLSDWVCHGSLCGLLSLGGSL